MDAGCAATGTGAGAGAAATGAGAGADREIIAAAVSADGMAMYVIGP